MDVSFGLKLSYPSQVSFVAGIVKLSRNYFCSRFDAATPPQVEFQHRHAIMADMEDVTSMLKKHHVKGQLEKPSNEKLDKRKVNNTGITILGDIV